MERENLHQLSIFVAVAEARGFREAARRLSLSSSAVSQSIARLERSSGVRLFERSTRSVQLTPEGERLFAEVGPPLANIREALEAGWEETGRVRGRLRITMPRIYATHMLAGRLADFARAFPLIRLEIRVDDATLDIVSAGFDAGIRLREQLERDMIAVPVSEPQRMIAVASPAFLAKHAPPAHPRDLIDLPCIGLRMQGGAIYAWEFEKDGESLSVAVPGSLIVNDDDLALQACRDGAGIAFLFEPVVRDALATGCLVPLLEDWSPYFPGFYLYHTSHRQMRPPLRAFIDWLRGPSNGTHPRTDGRAHTP